MGEIAKEYVDLLIEKLKNTAQQYAVYDYSNDFDKFWQAKSTGNGSNQFPEVISEVGQSSHYVLIIVWDSLPQEDGTAKLGPHLTPLDWALAFSTKMLRPPGKDEKKKINFLPFCIHIVDLTSTQFENVFAMQMAASICEAMPWVKIYAPLPRGRRAYENPFPVEGLQTGDWPKAETMLSNTIGSRSLYQMESLNKAWQAWVVQSRDHHDVNNIIGPDILAKKGSPRRDGLPAAFLTRLGWTGYDLVQAADWESWKISEAIPKLFNRTLSVLVIDDQLQQGWGRFVCRLFDAEKDYIENSAVESSEFIKLNRNNKIVNIWGCLGSQPLITFLTEKATFNTRDYTQQVIEVGKQRPEVILLDLRLYSRLEEARDKARKLCEFILDRVVAPLAWREIDHEEIRNILKWANSASESKEATDNALLLLPRLLALALPLTPIILFSSTGQAKIREKLKPYWNIFTGFEKPRVLSNPDSVKTSISALHECLDKAVSMMRLKLQLAHAQRAVKKAEDERKIMIDGCSLTNQHIEIYADETRTLEEGITSGLAVCVYPDCSKADVLQEILLKEHSKGGVVWAKLKESVNTPVLEKGSEISSDNAKGTDQVEKLVNLLNNRASELGENQRRLWSVVATKVPKYIPKVSRNISLASFPDASLDDALRYNIEFTLYVLLPYFSMENQFSGTIQIHLPTRVVPFGNSMLIAYDLCDAFDLGPCYHDRKANAYLVPTSNFGEKESKKVGTAFPLVRGWLHEWREASSIYEQIKKIMVTCLSNGTNEGITPDEAKQRRLFHDIADWVCSASTKKQVSFNTFKWPLRDTLIKNKVFNLWFTSTDGTLKHEKANYEFDFSNGIELLSAFKASFRGPSSENDALWLMLRNTNIENCDMRLIDSPFCQQQRLILWMLRFQLNGAHGRWLHSLLPTESGILENSPLMPDQPVEEPESEILESDKIVSLSKEETVQLSEEEIYSTPALPELTPQVLDDAFIKERFPGSTPYVVVFCSKRGDIFFKNYGSTETKGSHWTNNQDFALQLSGDGWATPRIVYGHEISSLTGDPELDDSISASSREVKRLWLDAAKLADGRWKVIGAV